MEFSNPSLTPHLLACSLYRWHAAISRQDEEWIEAEMRKWGPKGKAPAKYDEKDFFEVYYSMTKAMGEMQISPEVLVAGAEADLSSSTQVPT